MRKWLDTHNSGIQGAWQIVVSDASGGRLKINVWCMVKGRRARLGRIFLPYISTFPVLTLQRTSAQYSRRFMIARMSSDDISVQKTNGAIELWRVISPKQVMPVEKKNGNSDFSKQSPWRCLKILLASQHRISLSCRGRHFDLDLYREGEPEYFYVQAVMTL